MNVGKWLQGGSFGVAKELVRFYAVGTASLGKPEKETVKQERQRHYEEQRDIWAREFFFWCKHTETFESRQEGKPSKAVSGHWFHNKGRGLIEK